MSGNVFQEFRYGVGKLLYAIPIYRYTLVGRAPTELAVVPPDAWPGNAERGSAISAGELSFLGETVRGGKHAWHPVGMSDAWLAELHGFDWLRDLRAVGGDAARRRARDLVGDWIERQTSWQEIAWRPDVLATRLYAWLGQHDFFCASADDVYRRRYIATIARQTKHLSRVLPGGVEGAGLIRASKGLIAAGAALGDNDGAIRQGLRVLERAVDRQIRPDGGHISRNPQIQETVLRDLVDVRSALLASETDIPSFLLAAIDRAAPFLRMLRHNDGGLALFNGSGEGEDWLIDMLLSQADARGRAPARAPHSGFRTPRGQPDGCSGGYGHPATSRARHHSPCRCSQSGGLHWQGTTDHQLRGPPGQSRPLGLGPAIHRRAFDDGRRRYELGGDSA